MVEGTKESNNFKLAQLFFATLPYLKFCPNDEGDVFWTQLQWRKDLDGLSQRRNETVGVRLSRCKGDGKKWRMDPFIFY